MIGVENLSRSQLRLSKTLKHFTKPFLWFDPPRLDGSPEWTKLERVASFEERKQREGGEVGIN